MKTTLKKIYTDFRGKEGDHEVAQALLRQSDWFCRVADFDPRSGDALPQSLSSVLAKVAKYSTPNIGEPIRDRLWRIAEHSRNSVDRLFRALNESPRREQALQPVHAVRELDANSFIKLSNRPGRNIREKLAGKPYVHAVRRFQSVNLPENRLLKAFATHLAELLELRRDYLDEEDNDLLPKFQSWLRSAEVQAIGSWDNLPPNNTLLSHRDYRRVWDAWRWLQSIDEDIARDFSRFEAREETMRLWTNYAQMWKKGSHHFVEMPILFDYERFEICPWLSQLALQQAKQTISRELKREEFFEPACVDLTSLRPSYATRGPSRSLSETYLWQQWMSDGKSVDVELFNADAAYLHSNATSISAPDLFFANSKDLENFDSAARSFASELRKVFKSDTLIWLFPDSLNDFELEIFRRNLNARFPNAEPLPRSVAAAFELVDYSRVTYDSYPIAIVDCIGGKTCVTKLLARFDEELEKRLPETNGLYWERCPPVIIKSDDTEIESGEHYDIITVDGQGQWHQTARPAEPKSKDQSFLENDYGIGKVEICINLTQSPVAGGTLLHSFQQRAGDIPLWRDQIAKLSIKVMKDCRYQLFPLVSRSTPIKPIRGAAVSIPVDEYFTLSAGKAFYQFPLFLGENANDIGFAARLESHAFKLEEDLVCKLSLTFEYGADEPYKLVFIPLDESFPPVRATWQKMEDVITTDALSPQYPAPMLWDDLRHFPDIKYGGTMDLIMKLNEASANLTKWTDWNQGDRIAKFIKGWCRFLVIQIWRDGRNSSEDLDLKNAAEKFKFSLSRVLASDQKTLFDVRFLECCMHNDAPPDCVNWIAEQVNNCNIREKRAIGFALGSVSAEWQKDVLSNLVVHHTNDALRVFAYAIWREPHFVEKFSLRELLSILNTLNIMLGKIKQCPPQKNKNDKWTSRNWVRATTEPLELLLGLLRTRSSSDPEIRMILQPHQKITKELATKVEKIAEIVAQSNVPITYRVQIDIKNPEGDRCNNDLFYALRLYLTGDDGSKDIHITSVSDSDND